MEQQRDDRSLGELFSELSSNTSNLSAPGDQSR